jgi:hypothetical protein
MTGLTPLSTIFQLYHGGQFSVSGIHDWIFSSLLVINRLNLHIPDLILKKFQFLRVISLAIGKMAPSLARATDICSYMNLAKNQKIIK